jgi:ferric-dicitrate binding protein FerR (iron transport regulator)
MESETGYESNVNKMKSYVKIIIDLCSRPAAGHPLREKFHRWLVNDRFPAEKEAALLALWNQIESMPAGDTLASLESLRLKRRFAVKRHTVRFTVWKYAAAVAFIAMLSVACLFMSRAPQEEVSFTEYFTGCEQSDTVILPDGSVVQTNSGTLFIVPGNFGKATRTLYLSGEACFKVVRNTGAPFIVKTKHMSVIAVGTEFKVTGYAEDPFEKATLISGSIRISVAGNQTDFILRPGEQFVCSRQVKNYSINRVNLHDETAWQRDELVFRGATLREILTVLERKYAVSFQYNAGIPGDDRFNFHFRKASTLTEIMDIIQTVAGPFDWQVIDNKPRAAGNEQ